jgi:hypothetical protein
MNRFALLWVIALTGCAATYAPPVTPQREFAQAIEGSKSDLARAAKQVLISEGYRIAGADESAGKVTTAKRNIRLTPEQADCGTTMGINYLWDDRTTSAISIGIFTEDNKVAVKVKMTATYMPDYNPQSIAMMCVSTGSIEKRLMGKIAAIVQQ